MQTKLRRVDTVSSGDPHRKAARAVTTRNESSSAELSQPAEPTGLLSAAERATINFIPDAARHGKVGQQGVFWFLSNTQPLSVAVGFLGVSLGLSVGWTIVALVAGTVFGTALMALHASQGPHLGLPQMLQSRAQFGFRGVVIPLIAALVTFAAYTTLDSIILALGFDSLFGIAKALTIIVSVAVAVVLAAFGYDWLHRVFRWALWVSLPLWVVLTVGVLAGGAGGTVPPSSGGFSFVPFAGVFAYTASINLGYAVNVSDYSRYLPRTTSFRTVIATTYAGAAVSLIWLSALGAWMAAALGVTDGLQGISTTGNNIVTGLGTVLTVVASIALVATMGEVLYSGSLTLLTTFSSLRSHEQIPTAASRALAAAALGVLSAVAGLVLVDRGQTAIYDLILIVFYVLVPWSAINLTDYFFVRRGRYAITHLFTPNGVYGGWSRRGLIAYVVGLAAVVPFVQLSFWRGFAVDAVSGVDVSYISGLVVASVVYYLLARNIDARAETAAVDDSTKELIALGLLLSAPDATASEL